jgi:hypothetical protein
VPGVAAIILYQEIGTAVQLLPRLQPRRGLPAELPEPS